MKYSPILLVHICTAILGILSGPVALISRKGSRLHRWSGNVFFISMLSMSASAVFIAAFMSPNVGNVMVGVLTFYLVATAWATVKRKERRIGLFEFGAMLVVLADAAAFLHFGREAANSATGVKDGIPAAVYFVFGSVAFLAAALDIRMLISGGVSGALRIARHLWRMCFALLIAETSFFLGKQQHFPKAIRNSPVLIAPTILILVAMIYWLSRVWFRSRDRRRAVAVPSGASLA
jgi:uncharacterized membrane protein